MLVQLKRFLKRLKKIQIKDWRVLILLMAGAFVQGLFLTQLNVSVLDLYLSHQGIFDVGFDFLIVGIIISVVGRLTVKLDRRKGYGGAPLTALLFFILGGLFYVLETTPSKWVYNALFIYAYTVPVLLQVAFWTIANRFIPLRLDSFKFTGIFACQWLGFMYASGQYFHVFGVDELLYYALVSLGILFGILKVLVWLLPVPSETFVKKSGGVQDSPESKLVVCILMMSLIFTTCQALSDYLLFHLMPKAQVGSSLSYLWLAKGLTGLFCLCLLRKSSYIYYTIVGSCGICAGFILMGGFYWYHFPILFCLSYVAVSSFILLYWGTFLQMLPRLLVLGEGVRIRHHRDVLCLPLGWILAGSLILTFYPKTLVFILMAGGLILGLFLLASLILYNRFFIQMYQVRRWFSGPLMLLSQKAVSLLKEGIQKSDLNEVLYAYRLMNQTGYAGYQKHLIKGLKHPHEEVRRYCVERLDKMGGNAFLYRQLNQAFLYERNEGVKARLLAALIHRESEENPTRVFHKYGDFLDDKKLKSGAILGFLQSGGECALLAMDGLQHLAQSKKTSDIFQALDIIEQVPQTGLIRLVLPLLKHPDIQVVQRAILTAGTIGHTQSLSFILSALDNPQLQEVALRALKMYDKQALPPIEKMIANPIVPFPRRKKLVEFLAYLPTGEGKQILLRQLNLSDQKLRKEVLRAILNSKIIWSSHARQKTLKESILKDVQNWHWLKENMQKCAQAPESDLADSFGFLYRSFSESMTDLRWMILAQLMILYPDDLTERAIRMILKPAMTTQMNGIELLQDLVSNRLYRAVYPVLMAPWEEQKRHEKLLLNSEKTYLFFKDLILHPQFPMDRWAYACCLYGLKSIGTKGDMGIINQALQTPWKIVWSAALEATDVWLNEKEKKQFLIRIETDMPHLPFVHYLKKRREDDYV